LKVVVAAAGALSLAGVAWGQELNDRSLGQGYAHLISFQAEPEIAAAWFTIDSGDGAFSDGDLSTTKLPLYREFDSDQHRWRWFGQFGLSYMTFEESIYIPWPDGGRESLTPKWTAFGGMLEGGLILPLGAGFSFVPSLGLGISRLENELDSSLALLEDLLPPEWDGALFDWDTLASIARAHAGLRYEREHGKARIKGAAHLSYSYIDSFDESRNFAGFHDHSSTFAIKLDAVYPLGMTVWKRPLDFIGHVGNTTFLGSGRDELDFSYFNELGASLGVRPFAIGLLWIFGEDVEGWSVTFNYDY
jgi:hypothetical protein